jgi:predicted  nucleic acid-binding Zn-ribbon protein
MENMENKCENCSLEQRISTLERDMQTNDDQHKVFYAHIIDLEKSQTRTDTQYETIMSKIKEMSAMLEEIKNTPTKNWNLIITSAISGIVAVIIGMIFSGGI